MESSEHKKICEYCGQPWEFAYKVVYFENGEKICYHDNKASSLITTDDEKQHRRLLRRGNILKEHYAKRLPKEYYRTDPETGKQSLLPKHIHKYGF